MIAAGKEKELLDFWQKINMGEILGFDAEYIKKKAKKEFSLSYVKLSFLNFMNIIRSHGINPEGLEKVLTTYLTEEEVRNSTMDYGLCTVKLKNLKPIYIFKEEMIKGKLFDYILASCYLPIFKAQKKVDDNYYLDGGFYDNLPVNMLIDKGYNKIYVVELNPVLNITQKPKKEVEIIRIVPKRSLGGVINFSTASVQENIKMGYYDTIRQIENLDGYHYCFKNYPAFLYDIYARKIKAKEMHRLMGFFNTHTQKETIIKAIEYVMIREGIDYYQIYQPFKMLKKIRKQKENNHFVYKFLRKIKFL